MRCFQADCVFPVYSLPLQNGMVVTEEDGTIVETGLKLNQLPAFKGIPVETHKGVLVPGFINTHCHLELSWMKGQIARNTGITGFIKEFVSKRGTGTEAERQTAIGIAEEEMVREGIVAVGDISNGSSSFAQKSLRKLYYHTFIEAFDLHPSRADESFARVLELRSYLLQMCPGSERRVSIVAHAPYTVSPELHRKITEFAAEHHSPLSIHNQESREEDELFKTGKGKLMEMYQSLGLDYSWFKSKGGTSLNATLPFYEANENLLLVHNTFTSEADLFWARSLHTPRIYWATCPRANLFIEGRLPDYTSYLKHHLRVTIGTDSLASNTGLSVLEELKTISFAYPTIPLETLFRWATLNGAEFLGIDDQFGSLEPGKKPGLVLVDKTDGMHLSEDSRARRIL
jgi:cytosine/adenosine deaminase-related metal-dependent hydrolase